MAKIGFVIQTEPYKFQAVDTLFNMIDAARRKGHEILGVFFFGSGGYGVQKRIDPGATVRNLPEAIKTRLADQGIALIGCRTWLQTDGMSEEVRLESVRDEGLAALTEIAKEADKLIVFGAGV